MGKKIVDVFAETLTRIIGPGERYASIIELEKKSQVGKSTLARARNGETATKIDNLEDIAHAYGLEPWQLLVPGVDPKQPPTLSDGTQGASWPFTEIDERKLRKLGEEERLLLEGAIVYAAARLGLDVKTNRKEKKEAM